MSISRNGRPKGSNLESHINLDTESTPIDEVDAEFIRIAAAYAIQTHSNGGAHNGLNHVAYRRAGLEGMLHYLAGMPVETDVERDISQVSLRFQGNQYLGVEERHSVFGEQLMQKMYPGISIFRVDRAKIRVPVDNLKIVLPEYIIAINQLYAASRESDEQFHFEIDSLISTHGWESAFVGMAACDLSIDDILKAFTTFEKEYGNLIPYSTWFETHKAHLLDIYKRIPPMKGVNFNYSPFNNYWSEIGNLMTYPENPNLDSVRLSQRREALRKLAPITVKSGRISMILPSSEEVVIRKILSDGGTDSDVYRVLGAELSSSRRFHPRFVTMWTRPYEIDFYPIKFGRSLHVDEKGIPI